MSSPFVPSRDRGESSDPTHRDLLRLGLEIAAFENGCTPEAILQKQLGDAGIRGAMGKSVAIQYIGEALDGLFGPKNESGDGKV